MDQNMKRLILAACGVASIVLWLVLPIYSFLPIPLLINGIMMINNINQIGILFLLFMVAMIIVPFLNNKIATAVTGAVNAVAALMSLFVARPMFMNGNLRWVFLLGTSLIQKIVSFFGYSITTENVQDAIKFLCDNFMQGGVGLWLWLVISLVYAALAFVLDIGTLSRTRTKSVSTENSSIQHSGTSSNSPSKGFSHRT